MRPNISEGNSIQFFRRWVVLLCVCSAAAVVGVIVLVFSGPSGKEGGGVTRGAIVESVTDSPKSYLPEKIPQMPDQIPAKAPDQDSEQAQASPGPAEETVEIDPVIYDHVVWIGDSRTVGMYWALTGRKDANAINWYDDEGNFWSAAVGMGLDWMKSTGAPQSEEQISEDTAVIILLGVNDIGGEQTAGAYCDYINRKAREWTGRGASVFFVSSNPVKGTITNGIGNRDIETFNQAMSGGLDSSITFVDTYHYLGSNIVYKDHVHYEDETNLKIYNAVRRYISFGTFE